MTQAGTNTTLYRLTRYTRNVKKDLNTYTGKPTDIYGVWQFSREWNKVNATALEYCTAVVPRAAMKKAKLALEYTGTVTVKETKVVRFILTKAEV